MAQIKQVGIGRKSSGTIDGITYYVLNGKTYARSTPTMPASVFNTTEARIRQAIFKMIQMHLKHHLRTIRQTVTPKNGSPNNRYYSLNCKALALALQALAEQYVDGADVTITDVEAAISAYAALHPTSIKIASKSGYQEVYLTGEWPETITLNALSGDSTVIIIVNENGVTTTINADGTVTTDNGSSSNTNPTNNTNDGSGGGGSNTNPTNAVEAPVLSGSTPFAESTSVTITGPSGAQIHYTTDGSTPTSESTLYSEAISLSETTTVKAIAIKDGTSSEVASKTFTKSSGGADAN